MGRDESVVHDGQVVRRETHSNGGFVRDVLSFSESRGFGGAPRFLGVDREGREVVSFVVGEVFEDEEALSDAQVASAGRLLRRLHDVFAGSVLANDEEVVGHGDAGPHNVGFRGEEAVAVIDWKFAAPGSRLGELANVAWCLLDERWEREQVGPAARRIGVFCRAYGWDDLEQVIDEVRASVRRARDSHADQGIPRSVEHFERLLVWLDQHDDELKGKR